MATETLKIVITADNKDALASLKQTAAETDKFKMSLGDLNTRLSLLKERLSQATEPAKITKLGSEIRSVTAQILEQEAAYVKLGAGAATSATTMVGGLQKAYSGLRVIANIIPGIGIAGIFGLALEPLMELVGGFGKLTKAEEAAKKANDEVFTSLAKDASQINVLVEEYKNTNLSLEQRGFILKKLNSISPEYFKGLQAENTTYDELKKNLDAYTDSLSNQIKAKVRGLQLEKDMTDLLKKQDEQKKIISIQEDFALKNKTGRMAEGSAVLAKEIALLEKKIGLGEKEIAGLTKVEALDKKKETVTKEKPEVGSSFFGGTFKKKDFMFPFDEEQQKTISDTTDRLKLLDEQINKIAADLKKERGKDFFSVGSVKPVKSATLTEYDEKQNDILYKRMSATNKLTQDQNEYNAKIKEQVEIAQNVSKAMGDMFAKIAEGGDPFEVLRDALKRLIIDLGITVVKALALKAIMAWINPGATVGKEIGQAMAMAAGGYSKGGVSEGPQGGHMELLHGTEAILTPAQMSGLVRNSMNAGAITSMGSNSAQQGSQQGEFTLRGNDLVLAMQRSNYSLNLRRG